MEVSKRWQKNVHIGADLGAKVFLMLLIKILVTGICVHLPKTRRSHTADINIAYLKVAADEVFISAFINIYNSIRSVVLYLINLLKFYLQYSGIDCKWTDWVEGECSVTCGRGTQVNTRKSLSYIPAYGGTCGSSHETVECNKGECPGIFPCLLYPCIQNA